MLAREAEHVMIVRTFFAVAALLAAGPSPGFAAADQPQQRHGAKAGALAFASTDVGDGRFELTLSGPSFTSRDAIEGDLLRRAAQLARAQHADWFVLLHLP